MQKATFIPMTSTPSNADSLRSFLDQGCTLVAQTEPATQTWAALAREGSNRNVAIFDTFADQSGRDAHFGGQVAAALQDRAAQLVDGGWPAVLANVENFDILAALDRGTGQPTKGCFIGLRAAEGQAQVLAAFLCGGRDVVEETEPGTLTWYALRSESDPNEFVIFDLFADEQGVQQHFAGKVAAALSERAAQLVEGGWEQVVRAIRKFDVSAYKAANGSVRTSSSH